MEIFFFLVLFIFDFNKLIKNTLLLEIYIVCGSRHNNTDYVTERIITNDEFLYPPLKVGGILILIFSVRM